MNMLNDNLLENLLNTDGNNYIEDENMILKPLEEEINLIYKTEIRDFVRSILVNAKSFWYVPSSISEEGGHPPDERAKYGNILHTQRVIRIARMLCSAQERSAYELDIITAAAILHDVTKVLELNGEFNIDTMHPYTVDHLTSIAIENDQKYGSFDVRSRPIDIEDKDKAAILRLIRCHMGCWSPIPETYPVTGLDWIMHFADLLATQLPVIIDGNNIKEWRWVEPKRRRRSTIPKEDSPPQ